MRNPASTLLRSLAAAKPATPVTAATRSPASLMKSARMATASAAVSPPTTSGGGGSHPLSNPTLANIEKRWEGMPLQEQADLWMALRDRMQGSWHDLTFPEKKAAYWIAFGPHGPRAKPDPNFNRDVFLGWVAGIAISAIVFATIRSFARPAPHTMTKEWQEASNEYLKSQNSNPIHGISSPHYTGKGMVQSPKGDN